METLETRDDGWDFILLRQDGAPKMICSRYLYSQKKNPKKEGNIR
jgi:hypothetical protein